MQPVGQPTVVSGFPTTTVTRPAVVGQPTVVSQSPVVRQLPPTQAPPVYVQAAGPPSPHVQQASAVPSTVVHTAPARTIVMPATYAQQVPGTAPHATTHATTTTVVRAAHPQYAPQVVRTVGQAGVQAAPVQAAAPVVQQQRPHTLGGPAYTQTQYEAKHQDDQQLQNLKELRKTSGLKQVPVNDGLARLKANAVDGKLSRRQFLTAYESLLRSHSVEPPPESVQNAVFDLFDRDGNHIVDMMELICGISLLCCGTEDDKILAVFNVFDEDGDGFISMDEMFKFLTSVFKVVLTPNVIGVMNSMGVTVESPEDLASVTALECFKTADLNHDGKLSVTEFKNWFYAPRNDPSFLFSPVRKLLQ